MPILLLAALALTIIVLWTCAPSRNDRRLLLAGDAWSHTTLLATQPPTSQLPDIYAQSNEVRLWRNWPSALPGQTFRKGEVWSEPFVPSPIIGIPVGGEVQPLSGNRILVECAADGRQRTILRLAVFSDMTLALVDLDGFCAGPVRLGAISGGKYFLVAGTPVAVSTLEAVMRRYFVPALGALLTAVAIGLLWTAASLAAVRMTHCARDAAIVGLLATGIGAMAMFWAFSISGPTGYGTLTAGFAAAIVSTVYATRYRRSEMLRVVGSLAAPVFAWLTFGFLVLSLGAAIDNGGGQTAANTAFYPVMWSTDNQLPTLVAHALSQWIPVDKINFGLWLISDRPQLLTGYLLFTENLMFFALPESLRYSAGIAEQAAGVMLVSLWVPITWFGLRLAGIRERQIPILTALAAFTGFCIFNDLYIWPKMLGAGFGLMMIFSLVALMTRPDVPTFLLSVAAASGALALLSHGGVIFGVAGTLIVFAATILRQGLRPILVSTSVGIGVLATWVTWQSLFQPGGNALIRYALTGEFGLDRRNVSVLSDVVATYSRLTAEKFLELKTDALLTLVGVHPAACAYPQGFSFSQAGLGALRFGEFKYLGHAIAVPALAALCCSVFRSRPHATPISPVWLRLVLVAIVTTLLWVAVTWDCQIVHHSAYQVILGVLIGCWGIAFAANRFLALQFAAFSVAATFVIWVADPLYHAIEVRLPWLLVLLILFAAGGAFLVRAIRLDAAANGVSEQRLEQRQAL